MKRIPTVPQFVHYPTCCRATHDRRHPFISQSVVLPPTTAPIRSFPNPLSYPLPPPQFVPFPSHSINTHKETPTVRITHPTHPLRGQSFSVIHQQHRDNVERLEIQLPDGECRLIPLDWTDQVPHMVTLPGTRFLLANLLCLCQRLDALLPSAKESSILPLNKTEVEGGSDGTHKSGRMVETDRGTACSDPRLAGSNVAPASRPTAGG